jgi:hypothetical protein
VRAYVCLCLSAWRRCARERRQRETAATALVNGNLGLGELPTWRGMGLEAAMLDAGLRPHGASHLLVRACVRAFAAVDRGVT